MSVNLLWSLSKFLFLG
ncbi:hypothetical protein MC885_018306 [Smutsia gigantea]|nr:hypothetical protein MC885_018306 [Smutsia gigantea]